jgi:Ca2+-binding RTX toxin-like protein
VLVNDQSFARVSRLAIDSGAGADEIRIDSLVLPATIESGLGADVIAGGPAPETIVAGDDADLVDGGAGQDTILLGAGNDTALETDGSVDGQDGTDTVRVSVATSPRSSRCRRSARTRGSSATPAALPTWWASRRPRSSRAAARTSLTLNQRDTSAEVGRGAGRRALPRHQLVGLPDW